MKRRTFIVGLGSAVIWSASAIGQQTPVIGFLSSRAMNDSQRNVAAFLAGLGEQGFAVGKNVAVEFRFAEGKLDRLPELAVDLVRRPVALLAAVGGANSAIAAKAATSTVPIVYVIGSDPVALGLATSLSRPGGNATGMTIISGGLAPKRLGLLHAVVPKATRFAAIVNPNTPEGRSQIADLRAAAQELRLDLRLLEARSENEIDTVFATLANDRVDALLVGSDPIFDVNRDKIIALVMANKLPAIYQFRDFAAAGGLMSYDPDIADAHRKVGVYAGQILKGKVPAELPIQQPTKFNFIINLKTAQAMGIEIPPTLLAQADEVIE
jgi:putative tryptophan/tyrosine transport system substrate-binding protein